MPLIVSENTTVCLPSITNSISSAMVLSLSSPASSIIRSLPLIFSIEFMTPLEFKLEAFIFSTACLIFVSSFTSFSTSMAFSSAFCTDTPSTIIDPGLLIRYSLGSSLFGAFAFITFPFTSTCASVLFSSVIFSSIVIVSVSSSSSVIGGSNTFSLFFSVIKGLIAASLLSSLT